MAKSPYSGLESRAFWKTGVAQTDPLTITDIYRRRFRIRKSDAIATAGSCFAQHIARNMRTRGFNVLQKEPAPRGMSEAEARRYGFGVYTCRYGNIYTSPQLLQLAEEAFGIATPADRVWEREGRYFDAQRPGVEPDGFAQPEHVLAAREKHLAQVRQMFLEMDVFVFTFGLTEAWVHTESGTVFPTAPGTIAGSFDPEIYSFRNFTHHDCYDAFLRFMRLMRRVRDKAPRYLITVSPVPLTATATNEHVLSATTYSKSVLRSVCGELYHRFRGVDYFPSYELIATHFGRGFFYESNMRSITEGGVENAMRVFFAAHDPKGESHPRSVNDTRGEASGAASAVERGASGPDQGTDLVCEEVLLEAFAR